MRSKIIGFILVCLCSGIFTQPRARSEGMLSNFTQKPECPTIAVECPTGEHPEGDQWLYKVTVTDAPEETELSYHWEISRGEILEGQGTTSIKVEADGVDAITVTVEVGGLGEGCTNTASCPSSMARREVDLRKGCGPRRAKG
ncbi:MAG TPA: hypothetical protein VM870_07165 [Pyrinomonadaceae bacterium]|jgi:hypothetical protein|nr:hypothetical protein [Pyrinomonadaceae bacterium]